MTMKAPVRPTPALQQLHSVQFDVMEAANQVIATEVSID